MNELVPTIWVNGRRMDPQEPAVSAGDFGLLYGEGLFETMKAVGGKIAYLDRHLSRLVRSAGSIGLPLPGEGEIRAGLRDLLSSLPAGDEMYRVRLTVTRGAAGSFDAPADVPPTLILSAHRAVPVAASWRAVWSPHRRNETSLLCRVKSVCFLENVLARRFARSRGVEEALFLNTQGELTEGSITNLFLVRGERLQTPPEAAGLLPGILRSVLIERAGEAGLSVLECRLLSEDLYPADAAFLTNSLLGVMPLAEVEGRQIGSAEIHPMAERLRKLLWRTEDFQAP